MPTRFPVLPTEALFGPSHDVAAAAATDDDDEEEETADDDEEADFRLHIDAPARSHS